MLNVITLTVAKNPHTPTAPSYANQNIVESTLLLGWETDSNR